PRDFPRSDRRRGCHLVLGTPHRGLRRGQPPADRRSGRPEPDSAALVPRNDDGVAALRLRSRPARPAANLSTCGPWRLGTVNITGYANITGCAGEPHQMSDERPREYVERVRRARARRWGERARPDRLTDSVRVGT